MPELPEVQTIVNDMTTAGLCGATIVEARVYWPRTIADGAVREFCRRIEGAAIVTIERRAKYLVMMLSNGMVWLVHLRMTGRFGILSPGERIGPHARALMRLDDRRRLIYYDTRKFGRFYLTDRPDTLLDRLGPEPLSPRFSARALANRLSDRKGRIKPLLLDQRFIAGLGNIYVDEALWTAGIHPLRTVDTLHWDEIRALHRAIRSVLRRGIRNAGTALGSGQANFKSIGNRQGTNATRLKVFRRTGLPCPRCGRAIERLIVSQRSTHVCGNCQQVSKNEMDEHQVITRKP